jgi:hypothetical protein
MSSHRIALLAAILCVVTACGSDATVGDGVTTLSARSSMRVINAGTAPLDVTLDGAPVFHALSVANVSATFGVSPGAHLVHLQAAGGSSTDLGVTATADSTVTTVAFPGAASSIMASVVPDTGSIVPAGMSKLRVSHFSANAGAIEIWRTQPDFQSPVHIMTPFLYQATSPYLQSVAGTWEVFVTAPNSTVKLATTGSISIPSGARRTVVLLDSAGVLRFNVIVE